MQITPNNLKTEERLSMIEFLSTDEILTKVTGLEEVNLPLHSHKRHQIIYILSGTLHIETENISYFVTDKHLIWIPEKTPHRISSNNCQISLLTSYFQIDGVNDEQLSIYRTDELTAHNLRFISSYQHIIKNINPKIYYFTISFLSILPDICQKASFPTQPFVITKDSRLLPILEYIKANLNQDLTIENVAFRFGFSVRNLTRLFTNSNIRFVHYLNYNRIVRAIEILTDNTMNIEQIAYEVGFNSPNSFSRVFKQITGEPPSTYIRKK